jgi:hypothetical protein
MFTKKLLEVILPTNRSNRINEANENAPLWLRVTFSLLYLKKSACFCHNAQGSVHCYCY